LDTVANARPGRSPVDIARLSAGNGRPVLRVSHESDGVDVTSSVDGVARAALRCQLASAERQRVVVRWDALALRRVHRIVKATPKCTVVQPVRDRECRAR
jgi:hypothetical protein